MDADEIKLRVNELMQQGFELQPAQLRPEALLKEDLGLDSLDAVDMLVYLEEKLGARIEGERLLQIRTLADVYQLVKEAADAAKSASAQENQVESRELAT